MYGTPFIRGVPDRAEDPEEWEDVLECTIFRMKLMNFMPLLIIQLNFWSPF